MLWKKLVIEELRKFSSQGEYLRGGVGCAGKSDAGHHLEMLQQPNWGFACWCSSFFFSFKKSNQITNLSEAVSEPVWWL